MRRLLLFLVVLALPASAATISGTTCPGSGCSVSLVSGVTALAVQVTGTWSGTIELQLSLDGTNYIPTQARPVRGGTQVPSLTESGGWNVTTAGWKYIRFQATAWTSGTATITTAPSPVVLPLDITPVVGSTFGEVAVAGTVVSEPSPNFLAALNPTRTFPEAPPAPTLTATVTTLDDPTITGRTELTVRSLANGNLRVWCCRGASCTPTSTAAYILIAGDAFRFEGIRDSDTIRCRAATDPVQINFVEVAE